VTAEALLLVDLRFNLNEVIYKNSQMESLTDFAIKTILSRNSDVFNSYKAFKVKL